MCRCLATLQSVATEKLSATVLKGKQLFYDARDTRLAREGYMSCASCHNDGGSDGRVWDLTGMGEGLRNTVSLRGKGGMAHGFLHWSGNFDEVQDFEGQIRALGRRHGPDDRCAFNQGTREQPLGDPKAGLSADLDALAAYVASLNTFAPSPHRKADGIADGGRCRRPGDLPGTGLRAVPRRRQLHRERRGDVARRRHDPQPGSGSRLGGPLTGLDHADAAWGLGDRAVSARRLGGDARGGGAGAQRSRRSATPDSTQLVAYLKQIDGHEPAPPPVVGDTTNPAVTITTPTGNATHTATATPMSLGGHGLGQRGRDAGELGQRPGRQRHGDGHDELVGERDRAASGSERVDGDGTRCGGQHQRPIS